MTSNINSLGTNQSDMRAHNERLVLTLLRQYGPHSKAQIAKLTGLSAQTVSVIMRQLEEQLLIEKGQPQRGHVGQPSIPFSLHPDGAFFLGVKVGRRSADMVLIDFIGEIRAYERVTYAYPTTQDTINFIVETSERILNGLNRVDRACVYGLGVAMPFELWSWADIAGVDAQEMEAWKTFDIVEELSERVPFAVYMQNDASAACAAELYFGKASLPKNFLYIYIGHFIGGGVVLDDHLFTGPTGNAGAIGPLRVIDRRGQPTELLEIGSLAILEQRLRNAGEDPSMLRQSPESWNIPEAILDDWVDECSSALAQATQSALAFIDFEAIVIDGYLSEHLRSDIVKHTSLEYERLDNAGFNQPEICAGTLGVKARPLGAASLPLSKRFMVE